MTLTSNLTAIIFITVKRSEYFLLHKNKRLTTVTKSLTTDAPQTCVMHCLATNGCLAINMVTNGNRCELTLGVTNNSDVVDISNSDVYVLSEYT